MQVRFGAKHKFQLSSTESNSKVRVYLIKVRPNRTLSSICLVKVRFSKLDQVGGKLESGHAQIPTKFDRIQLQSSILLNRSSTESNSEFDLPSKSSIFQLGSSWMQVRFEDMNNFQLCLTEPKSKVRFYRVKVRPNRTLSSIYLVKVRFSKLDQVG
jgi:hypothetical protein